MKLSGDVEMPLLGFGTWQMRGRQAYEATLAALETGYRHIDTATMYGNEPQIGQALRDSGLDRRDVFVTTKLPAGNAGREWETIRQSLRELGTDYVDLWLIHWPTGPDELVRTWEEFLAIREGGLARAVGVSNFSPAQIDKVTAATGQAPAANQIPWSPSGHDARLLAEHRDRGIVVEGYSSLKDTDLRDPVLAEIASRHAVTPAQVVLRWHLEHGIVMIPKSANRGRIEMNFDLYAFALDQEEISRIDALSN
ncbi:aldo/keto reductase [Nonomuraea sp. NPDC049784]|uniref:aldo/keto reductase n=1 Tax=Nonomuraea sp. NPDC049784 TaxID=3154361 RepID=UPI0033D3CD9C